MTLAIEAKNLSIQYGKFTAVHNVSFNLAGDKIYGLLGRNGSGKTSLLSVLASFRKQSAGELRIGGEAPFENAAIMSQVCLIQESGYISEGMKVKQVLELAGSCWDHWDAAFADELVNLYNLPLKKQAYNLSRGMKSALGTIIGLASRAPITIFDETYLGMDAPSRYTFYEQLLQDYMKHPRTIILSTHLIEEVSSLFEEVMILDEGRLIMQDNTESLRLRGVSVTGPASKVDEFAKGLEVLNEQSLGGTKSITVYGSLDEGRKKDAQYNGLEIGPVSLQDLFVHLTRKRSGSK